MKKNVNEENKKTEKEMEGAEKMQEKVKLNIATLSKVQKDLEEKSEIITKYPYINEDGEIIYEVWKMKNAKEPYYTMRPLGNGEYKKGLGKVKTIPYNLPNIIKAKEEGKVIIVTEGESKADVFNHQLGYCATTAPFSNTDKWQDRYNRYLKYANILVIADNDDKGREFAELTFETISDVADKIGILELSDIYPELKEGGDIEDLRNIVNDDNYLKEVLNSIIEDLTSDKEVE